MSLGNFRFSLNRPRPQCASVQGYSAGAAALLLALARERGVETPGSPGWPDGVAWEDGENQLWADLNGSSWERVQGTTGLDAANAAALGDVAGLVWLRAWVGLGAL